MNRNVEYWLEMLIYTNAPGTYVIDEFGAVEEKEHSYGDIIYQDGCIVIDGRKWKPFDLDEKIDRIYLRGKWIHNDGTEDESMIIGLDMNEYEVVTSIEQFECHIPGKEWSNQIGCISLLFNARFANNEPCGWYQGEWNPCKPKRLSLEELEQVARKAMG